jgi:hypothetical protein
MTDMSPTAVKDRLHIMDELWLLTVKLKDAKVRRERNKADLDVTTREGAEEASQNPEVGQDPGHRT